METKVVYKDDTIKSGDRKYYMTVDQWNGLTTDSQVELGGK